MSEIYRNYFKQNHVSSIGIFFYGLLYKAHLTRPWNNHEIHSHFTDLIDLRNDTVYLL